MKVESRPSIHNNISKNENKNASTNRSYTDFLNDSIELENAEETQTLAEQSSQIDSSTEERTSHRGEFEDENHSSTLKSAIDILCRNRKRNISLAFVFIVVSMAVLANNEPRKCSFDSLKDMYPNEDKHLWNYLESGNEDILNQKSDKPAVFLFVHNGKGIAAKIVEDIAKTSAECFGSSPITKLLKFDTKDAIADYGYVVDSYKKSIKEKNVILIANLNKIPGEAAKALHSICDTRTPLVKKVVILLLLTVKQQNMDQKLIDTVENELKELWEDKMKPNELDPIITRVTDQVFLLRSSNNGA